MNNLLLLFILMSQINKGTGAGGANTNLYGKKFEEKTNNYHRLLSSGYTKFGLNKNPKKESDFYLSKDFEDKTIVFTLQSGLKVFIKKNFNIDLFRYPDEAYLITYKDGRKIIKILEKKEQNVEGSVETKLWSGPSLKREYEIVLGKDFKICYGFCVNNFLENKLISTDNKKYVILNQILEETDIKVLFEDRDDYFETLDKWLET